MNKKIIVLLLISVFFISMFAACDNTNADDKSWETVQAKGELIIGLDDTFTPMGFRNEKDELVGFDIDLAVALCEVLGVKANFQPIDWEAKELELKTNKIDCIWNGMSRTPAREKEMTLTKNYLLNHLIIMSVPGKTVSSKEDLKNYNIGTQAKSSALEIMQKDPLYPELNVFEYNSYDQVIMDMDAGRIDVMVVDEVLGMYKNTKRDVPFEVSDVDFGVDYYVIGLRKGEHSLCAEIEKAFDTLVENGTAVELSNKWFGKDILVKD